ncbi:hypothetical protein [Actinomadura hibisca]|nr:hypothetical protein [Actinomadura hibisca]
MATGKGRSAGRNPPCPSLSPCVVTGTAPQGKLPPNADAIADTLQAL